MNEDEGQKGTYIPQIFPLFQGGWGWVASEELTRYKNNLFSCETGKTKEKKKPRGEFNYFHFLHYIQGFIHFRSKEPGLILLGKFDALKL